MKGVLKKEKTKEKNLIAVGDWVHFERIDQNSGVIHHIEERSSILIRAENLNRRKTHLMAANIDQVFIVTSLLSPSFKPLLVDRYILSAKQGHMNPIILINKVDLLQNHTMEFAKEVVESEEALFHEFLKAYTPLGFPIIQTSTHTKEGIETLLSLMEEKTSVFSGQSGVGKSSLINAALGSSLPTGPIPIKTNKGSHTTTSASLIPLGSQAFCIDTPGIKSFGLWENSLESIEGIFPDFLPFKPRCKFPNCSHRHEPTCGIKEAVENQALSPMRYQSYLALLDDTPPKEWE